MARFDLINEFTSVYVPSLPTHPTRHNHARAHRYAGFDLFKDGESLVIAYFIRTMIVHDPECACATVP